MAVGRQPRPTRQNEQNGHFAQNVIFEQSEFFLAKRSLRLRAGRRSPFLVGFIVQTDFSKMSKMHFLSFWTNLAQDCTFCQFGAEWPSGAAFVRNAFAILGGAVLAWAP